MKKSAIVAIAVAAVVFAAHGVGGFEERPVVLGGLQERGERVIRKRLGITELLYDGIGHAHKKSPRL